MPNYKIIDAETKGDIYIEENSQYNNLKADRVVVSEDIAARLFGTVNGDLVLKKNARVFLHGSVKGKVENQGGEISIY